MQWQPAHWNAGAECSFMDQQCRCRLKTVIVQLLWVGAQLFTLYNTVEYPFAGFSVSTYTQKIGTIVLYALTLPNINRFSKLFYFRIRRKFVIILLLKIPPHLKCVATLPCEMWSVLKATIENKTTSVTTHFKKVTIGNNVFIVSVIVYSNCHILQFLHQMFNVSALLWDDALKPATPLTNGAINETLRHLIFTK